MIPTLLPRLPVEALPTAATLADADRLLFTFQVVQRTVSSKLVTYGPNHDASYDTTAQQYNYCYAA